jgi:hypothetical protein
MPLTCNSCPSLQQLIAVNCHKLTVASPTINVSGTSTEQTPEREHTADARLPSVRPRVPYRIASATLQELVGCSGLRLLGSHSLGLLGRHSLGLLRCNRLWLLWSHSLGLLWSHSLGLFRCHRLWLLGRHGQELLSTFCFGLWCDLWLGILLVCCIACSGTQADNTSPA